VTLLGCAVAPKVSFQRDVYPILEEKCLDCHRTPEGKGYKKTGLNMETYESLMQGSDYGPVVLPADGTHSPLIMLVEGRVDASLLMPYHKDELLNETEIVTLRTWVEQGAKRD